MIPSTVVRELDGIKQDRGRYGAGHNGAASKGARAQECSRWILQALRTQKETDLGGARLPDFLWGLHVLGRAGPQDAWATNDEEILATSSELQARTKLPTVLCTADVNLRLAAEASDLTTLDLNVLLKSVQRGDDKGTAQLAKELLEQWTSQLESVAMSAAEEEENHAMGDHQLPPSKSEIVTQTVAAMDLDEEEAEHAAVGLAAATQVRAPVKITEDVESVRPQPQQIAQAPAARTAAPSSASSASSRWAVQPGQQSIRENGHSNRSGAFSDLDSLDVHPSHFEMEREEDGEETAVLNRHVDLPPPSRDRYPTWRSPRRSR